MTAYDQPDPPATAAADGGSAETAGARRAGSKLGAIDPFGRVILGAALIAFVVSFFPYYYSYDPAGAEEYACVSRRATLTGVDLQLCSGDGASAWHGLFGWLGVVLILLGALAVLVELFAPRLSLPVPVRLLGTGLAAGGVVSSLLALLLIPEWPPVAGYGLSGGQYGSLIDNGVAYGWYVVLGLGIVVTALSLVRFRRAGRARPT